MPNSFLISNRTSNNWLVPKEGYFDTNALSYSRDPYKFTIAATFCLDWDPTLLDVRDNNIYSVIHAVDFSKQEMSMIEILAQIKDQDLHITFRVSVPQVRRYTLPLPGSWKDYNLRWMTAVFSCTQNKQLESYLYDTENSSLLQQTCFYCDLWNFPDFSWLDIPRCDTDIKIGGHTKSCHGYRLAHVYGIFGYALDPDQNIMLCAPNVPEMFGNIDAWYNVYLDTYERSGSQIFFKSSNSKIYKHDRDHVLLLNNSEYFHQGYSNQIPKSWI